MSKKHDEDWDDGRTIAPMTGDELPSYRRASFLGRENRKNLPKGGKADLTKKEKRAMTRAMFLVMLPRLVIVLAGFAITALLMWLWLR